MSVRRIDLVVLHWDGSKTVRQGVTADEMRDVVREMARLSNAQPMEFSEPVKHEGGT